MDTLCNVQNQLQKIMKIDKVLNIDIEEPVLINDEELTLYEAARWVSLIDGMRTIEKHARRLHIDLNKGKMKAITKVKKGFKPGWNTEDTDLSFVRSKRGGSPMIKVGNNKYLGIGHSTKYFLKSFKQLGSTQRAYIYFFDFKKKIYYTNYLTDNKIGGVYCFGSELVRNTYMIKFYFSFSSTINEYIISNIYLFNVELDKEKLIRIAKRGTKKKIDFISGVKEIK